jgi:hypothetical protein
MANGAVYDEDKRICYIHDAKLEALEEILLCGSPSSGAWRANARLHRRGQKEHLIVHHILAKGTIDEDVMKVMQKKETCQNDLLEAVKARLKKKHSWRVK